MVPYHPFCWMDWVMAPMSPWRGLLGWGLSWLVGVVVISIVL